MKSLILKRLKKKYGISVLWRYRLVIAKKTYLINISSLFGQKITKYFLPWKWNQLFKSQYQCNVGRRFFVRENIRYLFLSFLINRLEKLSKKDLQCCFPVFELLRLDPHVDFFPGVDHLRKTQGM